MYLATNVLSNGLNVFRSNDPEIVHMNQEMKETRDRHESEKRVRKRLWTDRIVRRTVF